ncbi:MAG: ATP-binding cassette domain-containing protein [Lachnospiraceae bacterium]|nr:ATP-binding cassette domain-containing protein [Lachnospiraceae bacterium]
MLELKNISIYSNNVSVEDISFQIDQGDFFVIFGPDDSGKTELLNTIMGISPIYSGNILYRQKSINRLSISDRKSIRFVSDDILLQNIRAKDYLKHIAFTYHIKELDFRDSLIKYFNIDTSEYLTNMTYENNKLVAIIGALMTFPEFLILDEPFNFLTTESSRKLLDMLKKFNDKGMTILIATENFEDTDNRCNRLMYINDGKLINKCKIRKDTVSYKSLTITSNDFKHIEKHLGTPFKIDGNKRTYISAYDFDKINTIIKQCNISDNNINIQSATLKDALDFVSQTLSN